LRLVVAGHQGTLGSQSSLLSLSSAIVCGLCVVRVCWCGWVGRRGQKKKQENWSVHKAC
jgi:hypothetical protein